MLARRRPTHEELLQSSHAHAARAHSYWLMARAALWLARSELAAGGERACDRQRKVAQTYRSLAKEERQKSRAAFDLALGR